MNERAPASPKLGSVEFWAQHMPNGRALCEGARSLTFAEWNSAADRVAQVLADRANIGPDDRVAVCTQNRLEWFIVQAAIAKLGAALVPISHRLTPAEIHYIVADSHARAFVFDAEDVDGMARVWTNQPPSDAPANLGVVLSVTRTARSDVHWFDDASTQGQLIARIALSSPRSIVYTSGTTGRPRGVVQGRASKEAGAPKPPPRPERAVQPRPQPGTERNLLGAPLNHSAGQASARGTLAFGGTVFIMPRFDAEEALRVIDREKITNTFLVPTMLNRIVSLPAPVLARHDVSSIRIITTGASPCPQSVKERVIAYFGDHCLYESYGSTEVGLISRMLPEDHLKKPGACGRILDGVSVRLVGADGANVVTPGELGEIHVKTPVMIERYLNRGAPEELKDGYFATGDVGRFDADGFLYLVDRKKDMIIAGGVNIYPAEIEDALRQHAGVFDAVVFGVPHLELGEQVKAVIECKDGCSLTEGDLLAFVADKLAAYKRPRSIEFVGEIPRNAAGKPLKAQMRAPYWQAMGKLI